MPLERIVVEYQNTDGFTFSCTTSVPVEYSSMEEFKRDFELAAIKAYVDQKSEFIVGKYKFPIQAAVDDGEYYEPSILTLDQWFA